MTDRCPPIPIAVGPAARFRGLLALVLLAGCGPPAAMDAPATDVEGPFPRPEGAYEVRLDPTHMVPMRDGVRLATDLYFPVGTDTPLPVVQIRTPYGKLPHRRDASAARYFASHGFAVAVQDMRGRYQSEGEYFVSRADREDGYDMVSWLAEQPWSNGRIGTYGCSYLGENQMQLAATRNPHHAAALPQAAGGSYRYFGVIFGGVTELAASLGWFRGAGSKVFYRIPPGTPREEMLQVEEMINPAPNPGELDFQAAWRTLPYIDMLKASGAPPTDFEAFVSHEPGDPWWDRIGYVQPDDRFDVPALHVNSWYDLGVGETLKLFNLLSDNAESDRARDNQFAIISPTEVTGPIELVLYVSSDARDTDVVGKLVDVHPDGRAINVQEGILRARYREGYGRKVWMEPGEVYELRIDLQATANYFGVGHRIRLEITSSSFPRWERNLNTGGRNHDETEWELARNSVHHAPMSASRLIVPIVTGRPEIE